MGWFIWHVDRATVPDVPYFSCESGCTNVAAMALQAERIGNQRKEKRRTIADALEVLRLTAGLKDSDDAKVWIGFLQLPSGTRVGLVDVVFEDPASEIVWIASLPTSERFRGVREGASQPDVFEIARLYGAIVSARGSVRLDDETILRAVEVIPSRLPYEPTELDWRIVHATIAVIHAEDLCYRSLRAGLPADLQAGVPDIRFLDCAKLPGLELPPLKMVASLIAELDPTLERVSQQKIADALKLFGMRLPKPRPRRK
jgi:hypothetical protein